MLAESLTSWLSLGSLSLSTLKVIAVWLAFYGAGVTIKDSVPMRRHFSNLPSVIAGMLAFIVLTLVLSLFHIMNRVVLIVILSCLALLGLIVIIRKIRSSSTLVIKSFNFRVWMILPLLLVSFITITNIMIAGTPDLYQDDAHVTYMVQPDRWLDEGRMSYLEETPFSGFPMIAEMLFLAPSSFSTNRVDQLVLVQLFVMSALIASVIIAWKRLRLTIYAIPACFVAVLGCYQLVLWGHMAKPDVIAVFFVTVSMTVLLDQTRQENNLDDYTPFLVMGLALSTKLTAYLALVPFFILLLSNRRRIRLVYLLKGTLILAFIPVSFAIRTVVHTGSPFYPIPKITQLLKPEWNKPDLDIEFIRLTDRSSDMYSQYSILKNIWLYIREWVASIVLMICGVIASLRKRIPSGIKAAVIGIVFYALLSVLVFHPAWWGGKYGILLIPFTALVGISLLQRLKHGALVAGIVAVFVFLIYETNLTLDNFYGLRYRLELMRSYTQGEWTSENFSMMELDSYLPAIVWMNANLPEGSRVLSLFPRKRYFSDHEFFVLERHPMTARLLLDNPLQAELDILERMDIGYILTSPTSPLPLDGENRLEIVKYLDIEQPFIRPLVFIGEFVVYELDLESDSLLYYEHSKDSIQYSLQRQLISARGGSE